MDIDRIDNNSGYSPMNCRVVSKTVNAGNRRNNRIIDVGGDLLPLSQAARKLGLPVGTLSARVYRGLTGDRLVAPARPKRKAQVSA